jgi:hypothetical protein
MYSLPSLFLDKDCKVRTAQFTLAALNTGWLINDFHFFVLVDGQDFFRAEFYANSAAFAAIDLYF